MNKQEIINTIAFDHLVEKIVFKLIASSKNRFDLPGDLIQDIYIILLEKDEEMIMKLYSKKEIGYYILNIAKRQIFSTTSPYYYKYIKFMTDAQPMESAKDITTEDK